MPKTTSSFLLREEFSRQGSSIYYLMPAWQTTKTVRPGCTAGVSYPNYYLKFHCNSECGYKHNAELNVCLSFSTGNSVIHYLPISYLYRSGTT